MSAEAAFSPAPLARLAPSVESAAGYADGYAAGWAAGTRAAARTAALEQMRAAEEEVTRIKRRAASCHAAVALLMTAAEAARARTAPVLDEARGTLAAAALVLAEAVLGMELADGATSARAALLRALAVRDDEEVVSIRMHPEDIALLRTGLSDGAGVMGIPDGVELAADPGLARGDAVAELADGYLDARLSTALARVRRVLEEGE
jgi:flagellar assembly protein FliH